MNWNLEYWSFNPHQNGCHPPFITPMKEKTACFISDFREVNEWLVRKRLPIPKISTVLQDLDGFTFATVLELNMSYYTIQFDLDASIICTIIFPWRKYSYIRLSIDITGSPDNFQATMSDLVVALASVRTNLDDLLCITKACLDDHLNHFRLGLTRLQEADLHANAPKSQFCTFETEYLVYTLQGQA